MTMNVDYEIRTKVMNALIECRKEKGMSQKQLAEVLNSKETTVASWEQGKSLPSIDMLYRLSKYYNKTIGFMYGEKDGDDV
jgi:transcriptional regulator with XRE-family HTH domain